MVYCGKPSGGCHACRERKSRCDKLPEGCTQCKRAKRVCPGYRQLGDVIFHNESEKVARKAKAKEAKNKARRDAEDRAWTPPRPVTPDEVPFLGLIGDEVIDQSLVMLHPEYRTSLNELILNPRSEDVADGYFVTGYASRIPGESGPGRFDYLADRYNEYTLDQGLLSCIRAVGFASYANTAQSGVLLDKARYHYMQAIKLTNRALASTEMAKRDTTLLSILVLGIFETMTGTRQKSLKDWSQHISGAAAVIRLRGQEQIESIAGRRMLFQVTSNLLIVCIAQEKPLPDYLLKLTEAAVAMINNPDPALLVQRTMVRAAQLRADVRSGDNQDLQAILDEALKLDSALVSISAHPPEGWSFEAVHTDVESSYVWKGTYHVYGDCWISQLWNALRTIRIILNELVRKVLLQGFASQPPLFHGQIFTTQLQQATNILYQLQDEILFSVPQHLFSLPRPELVKKQTQARTARVNPEEAVASQEQLSVNQRESQGRLEKVLKTNTGSTSNVNRTLLPKPANNAENQPLLLPSHNRQSPEHQSFIQTPSNNSSSSPSSTSHSPQSTSLPLPVFTEKQRKTTVAARTYGGNFLMWPLYFAGGMDIATAEVRAFAVRNLRDVGRDLGIMQGGVLADLLEKGEWASNLV